MDLRKAPVGQDVPYEVNVIIEIPMGGNPVRYESDKEFGARHYPCNYVFIPYALSDDDVPTDAAVLGQIPFQPGGIIPSRPIGFSLMEVESGVDEKLLCVPLGDLYPYYGYAVSCRDLRPAKLDQVSHFFEHSKNLEPNKWVKVQGWGETEEALDLIRGSIDRADIKKKT